jgi:uncharacterized protein YjbI with pentapeptide repeats
MVNEEHYHLFTEAVNQELKQQGAGRELWNNWRVANPDVIPNLSKVFSPSNSQWIGCSPVGSGIKLIGFDFSRANLSGSFFSMLNLEEANLSGADLANATLCWGNLSRANLQGANLKKVNLNEANLARADLTNADLKEAQLAKANFKGAILRGADLSEAILHNAIFSRPKSAKISNTGLSEAYNRASLRGAKFNGASLNGADLSGADLSEADFSEAWLIEADLKDADLSEAKLIKTQLWGADLRSAFLINTDLSGANCSGAKLSAAYFIGANLIEADLTMTEAVATDFKQAILTGACIEDWKINSQTKLDNVNCDYVYLKRCQKERRPRSRTFAVGEFTKLFQKALETVDIVFLDGIEWKAFLVSFLELKAQTGSDDISIQSFENRNGAFIVRINVPIDADKAEIERSIEEKYQLVLKAQEKEISFLREEVTFKRGENTKLIRIIGTMAEKENPKYYFHQSQIGSLIDTAQSGSRQQSINNQHNYAPEQKQTLAEAVTEIQQLLKQLEQTNPNATETQQIEHINDETTPKFKKRVIGALQATGEAAIDEFILENKYLKVVKAAVKGWIKPE